MRKIKCGVMDEKCNHRSGVCVYRAPIKFYCRAESFCLDCWAKFGQDKITYPKWYKLPYLKFPIIRRTIYGFIHFPRQG